VAARPRSLHCSMQPSMNEHAQLVLWILHPVLQSAVAGAMVRRNLQRVFRIFFAYLTFQIATFFILFPIFKWGGYLVYFYAFWIYSAITLVLGFMVIHEIFLDVFRPYHTLKDLGSVLFRWAALVMLLVAGVVAASSPASEQGPLVQAIVTVQRCVRVVQCGLILFLLVFSKYLGVSWRQHSFGISLGFGSFAGAELAMLALNTSGHASQVTVNFVDLLSYNLAIATWFVYALMKSPARENSATLLMSQRWEQSLTDLQHPAPADSLIPMFEGMVDRAFSRHASYREPQEVPSRPLGAHRVTAVRRMAALPSRLSSKV
jgi:hypothetical protein